MSAQSLSRLNRFKQSNLYYSFTRDKVAMVCTALFLVFILGSLFAPVIAPYDPYDMATIDIMDSELPPSWEEGGEERFLLGTDAQGRDMLSTILYGTRISLTIGLCAVALQALLGIVFGLTAGYMGGKIDSLLMSSSRNSATVSYWRICWRGRAR